MLKSVVIKTAEYHRFLFDGCPEGISYPSQWSEPQNQKQIHHCITDIAPPACFSEHHANIISLLRQRTVSIARDCTLKLQNETNCRNLILSLPPGLGCKVNMVLNVHRNRTVY